MKKPKKSKKELRAIIEEIIKLNYNKSLPEVCYIVRLVYPDITDFHVRRVWTKYNENPYIIPIYLGSKTECYYDSEDEVFNSLQLRYKYKDVKKEI